MLASEAARVSEGGAPGARCRRGEPPHERKGGARHNPRTKSEPVRGPGFRQLGIEVDVKNAHNTIMSHMGMHGAKRAPPPPRAGVLAIRRQIARLLLRPTAQPRCHPGGLRVGRGGSPRNHHHRQPSRSSASTKRSTRRSLGPRGVVFRLAEFEAKLEASSSCSSSIECNSSSMVAAGTRRSHRCGDARGDA